MSSLLKEIDSPQFSAEVLDAPLAVVDFYSDECPPCEALAPKFEALAELYGNRISFVKMFRQKNRDLATSMGVTSSPSLLFFQGGKRVGPHLTGGIRRSDIQAQLDSMLPVEEVKAIHGRQKEQASTCEILILGAGPAGLTAAIYAAQAKRNTIVVDPSLAGGQISATHAVSNYPGFVDPVPGWKLAHDMSAQARAAGAQFRQAAEITRVDLQAKEILVDGHESIRAQKIILAMGASPRPLGVPGEKELMGKGLSTCATCDGKYYQDKDIIVVGGGDSALEESLFLTTFARSVTILYRGTRDGLRAQAGIRDRALAHPKITFRFRQHIREFMKGADGLLVRVWDEAGQQEEVLATDGVFLFIGMTPNLVDLDPALVLAEGGYIRTDNLQHTSIPDVFAVGDLTLKPFRQITIAAAEGTIAGIQAAKELMES